MRLAYDNADTFICAGRPAHYLDLQGEQADELDEPHRRLPCLAPHEGAAEIRAAGAGRRRAASSAGCRARTSIGVTMPCSAQAREACARPPSRRRRLLDRLTPAQIAHLEQRLAEENRKFATRVPARQRSSAPAARASAIARPAGGMGGEAVAGAGGARARLHRARAADRRAARPRPQAPAGRSARACMRAREAQAAAARALGAGLGARPRAGIRRRARATWRDEYYELLLDIDRIAQSRAAQHARSAHLRRYAEDFRQAPRGRNERPDSRCATSRNRRTPPTARCRATPAARATRSSNTRRCSPTPRSASPSRATAASSCATRSSPRCSATRRKS